MTHRPDRRRRHGRAHGRRRAQAISACSAASRCCAGRSKRCSAIRAIDAVRVVIGAARKRWRATALHGARCRRADRRAARSGRTRSAPGCAAIDARAGAGPRCRPPLLPAGGHRSAARRARGHRRRRAGAAARRHAGARRRRSSASRSTATGPVRVQTPQAFRLERLRKPTTAGRDAPPTDETRSLAPPGSRSPRSRATRCSTS